MMMLGAPTKARMKVSNSIEMYTATEIRRFAADMLRSWRRKPSKKLRSAKTHARERAVSGHRLCGAACAWRGGRAAYPVPKRETMLPDT